jgi:hypothetical protein
MELCDKTLKDKVIFNDSSHTVHTKLHLKHLINTKSDCDYRSLADNDYNTYYCGINYGVTK